MGWGKRIIGIGKAATGVVTGQPELVASGGVDIATSFGDKRGSGGVAQQTRTPVNVQPSLPMTSSSIEESRMQNKTRMKNIYEWP